MKKMSPTENPLKKRTNTGKRVQKASAKVVELNKWAGITSPECLHEVKSHLRQALKIAKIGSWDLDFTSGRLSWSDEVYRIFKIPQGTALDYEDFLQTVLPEDREYVDQQW
jgi:hypothetical protein